jgi:hypothetical protein
MQFPSFGSIITKELGRAITCRRMCWFPSGTAAANYEDYFRASFLGGDYDPMCIPDPAKPDFQVTDLSLPKSVSKASVEGRATFLKAWIASIAR